MLTVTCTTASATSMSSRQARRTFSATRRASSTIVDAGQCHEDLVATESGGDVVLPDRRADPLAR